MKYVEKFAYFRSVIAKRKIFDLLDFCLERDIRDFSARGIGLGVRWVTVTFGWGRAMAVLGT